MSEAVSDHGCRRRCLQPGMVISIGDVGVVLCAGMEAVTEEEDAL